MSNVPSVPPMSTLVECMQYLKNQGYNHEFDVKNGLLVDPYSQDSFSSDHIKIDNFYRFEGDSNPADNAILYAISTDSGSKGTLVDAYGTYSDQATDAFFRKVSDITKKISE